MKLQTDIHLEEGDFIPFFNIVDSALAFMPNEGADAEYARNHARAEIRSVMETELHIIVNAAFRKGIEFQKNK